MTKKPHEEHTEPKNNDLKSLFDLAYETIVELETPLGINASGKEDSYAAFFGRDSMITCLKLLRVHRKKPDKIYLRIINNTIKTAVRLQGKTTNLRSGEKPGKIIHEYREKGYYHLISNPNPWYVYPDKTLRNYDTTDSTLLFLILTATYYKATKEESFLKKILPSIEKALNWAEEYGHKGGNKLFVEYKLNRSPYMGGLINQGWMDSQDSLLIYGKPPTEPIALVETQGYYFKALRLWSEIFEGLDKNKANKLKSKADNIKSEFNKLFLMKHQGLFYYAYALFDQKAHILETRSNPGHCLWASVGSNKKHESIIDDKYISDVVETLMKPDLFTPNGGIRTLTTKSNFFDPCSYHNGSIWPFDNGLIAEGFENYGFKKEARKIKDAVLSAVSQFGTPIELYCVELDGKLKEYTEESGNYGSHNQAWTAATILDFTT